MKDLRSVIRETLVKCESRSLDDETDREVVEQSLFLAIAGLFGEAIAIAQQRKEPPNAGKTGNTG